MEKERLDTGSSKQTDDKIGDDSTSVTNDKDVERGQSMDREGTHGTMFFSPIQSHGQARSKPQTLRSARSHGGEDGYSCHQDEGSAEAGTQSEDEKRFEVKWDGDDDPMNPRSRSKFRKWIVVFIMAGSALCVYVQ
jgi:hypothetical protein